MGGKKANGALGHSRAERNRAIMQQSQRVGRDGAISHAMGRSATAAARGDIPAVAVLVCHEKAEEEMTVEPYDRRATTELR